MPEIVNTIGYIAIVLLGLGFIIFMHELGHFAVAKMVGIRCDQFAVGFGKAAFSFRKGLGLRRGTSEPEYYKKLAAFLNGDAVQDEAFRTKYKILSAVEPVPIESMEDLGKVDYKLLEAATQELGISETEYRINYLPLGGYVKMLGQEDMNPNATSDNPRAYNRKPIWARMCVISAGVVMNMIIAVPLFAVAFIVGVPLVPATVGGVVPDSPAAITVSAEDPTAIGLQPGDEMISIAGEEPMDFQDINMAVALAKADQPIEIIVERPTEAGETRTLTFPIVPKTGDEGLMQIGITPNVDLQVPKPKNAEQRERFDEVLARDNITGLNPGAKILSVNGQAISSGWQIERFVQQSAGSIKIQTDDQATVTIPVTTDLQKADDDDETLHLLGLTPVTYIDDVEEKSPSAGIIMPGDVIAQINNTTWPSVKQVRRILKENPGAANLTVMREGEPVQVTVDRKGTGVLGIYMDFAMHSNHVRETLADSPFADAALSPGSSITAINGQPVTNISEIRRAIQANGPGEIELAVTEPLLGQTATNKTITLSETDIAPLATLIWTSPLDHILLREEVPFSTNNPVAAAGYGFHKTEQFLVQTYVMLARLFQGSVPTDKLAGPLGMGFIGKRFIEKGFGYFLYFLGLISVNLAVINFLPLPIVDGGHFVLLLIEKVRGKPLPEPVMNAITIAGLALIGFVFIYVTKNDILNFSQYVG